MKILIVLLMVMNFLFGAVDINSAEKQELITLKGIGVKKAKAIVVYREKSCFKKIDEVLLVKGVGSKTFQTNKENLTVGKCKN